MTFKHLEQAKIHWNDTGVPKSNLFDDVYFSKEHGLKESRYVFLEQNQLPHRWPTFEHDRFVIAETGFGTGLNFLAAWACFFQFRDENPTSKLQRLHFISFEKFPLSRNDLEKAHSFWPELEKWAALLRKNYPPALAGCHRLIFEEGRITLDLWFGDINETLPQVWNADEGLVDAWFLDGFSPSKNPQMWERPLFEGMADLAKNTCTLSTFTCAGFVRRGLMDAGFKITKEKGFGIKRNMLCGVFSRTHAHKDPTPWYKRRKSQNTQSIAIIGGGIASATLAICLTRRGKNVTLYCEDEHPGEGASGNRQGAVFPLLNGDDDAVSRFFAPAFLFSRQFIQNAVDPEEFDHQWCGVTQLAWNEKSKKKIDKILNQGFPDELIRPLSSEQAKALTQVETHLEGLFFPLGGWLCPQELTQKMIRKAKENGRLKCHFNTQITALSQNETGWELQMKDAKVTHTTLIIANGHKGVEFKQTEDIPAYPVRGQVTHIKTTPTLKNLKTVLCYDGYLTPENPKNHTHCIGATYNRNEKNNDFRMRDQINNKARLVQCIDTEWANEIDIEHTQARIGVRSASRDHLPFVGEVCDVEKQPNLYRFLSRKKGEIPDIPAHTDLYCLLALGARGLTSAPLLGELLASQICGDPLPLPKNILNAVHPARKWVKKQLKEK